MPGRTDAEYLELSRLKAELFASSRALAEAEQENAALRRLLVQAQEALAVARASGHAWEKHVTEAVYTCTRCHITSREPHEVIEPCSPRIIHRRPRAAKTQAKEAA